MMAWELASTVRSRCSAVRSAASAALRTEMSRVTVSRPGMPPTSMILADMRPTRVEPSFRRKASSSPTNSPRSLMSWIIRVRSAGSTQMFMSREVRPRASARVQPVSFSNPSLTSR